MTVRIDGGTIYLEGRCPVDDAEALLVALQDAPASTVDVSGVRRLHMAVVQIVLAIKPTLRGSPPDPFLRAYLFPNFLAKTSEDN